MRPLSFVSFCERLGVRLEPAQRVMAMVAIDRIEPGTLTGADRELARVLFGDIDTVPPEARDVFELVKGARIGGSYIFGGLYSLYRACTAPLDRLAPGETGFCLIVAPDLRLARQTLKYALGAARKLDGVTIDTETSDSFTVRREGGRTVAVECLPATRGGSALRGRTYLAACFSEAAQFRDDSFVVNDTAIFQAVAPRVVEGGIVVIESTPWSEQGLLWELYRDNFGCPTTALVARAPTMLVRTDPKVLRECERERQRDPDNFELEFNCRFLGAGSSCFFDASAIDAAVFSEAA